MGEREPRQPTSRNRNDLKLLRGRADDVPDGFAHQ